MPDLPRLFIWAGFGLLGGILINLFQGCAQQMLWGDLFVHAPGGPPLPTRYIFFYTNLVLVGVYLGSTLIHGQIPSETMNSLVKSLTGLNPDQAVGLSGIAYLLSKVGGGDIRSLLGPRRT